MNGGANDDLDAMVVCGCTLAHTKVMTIATPSGARSPPMTGIYKSVSSLRDSCSIWPSPAQTWFGPLSDHGYAPYAQAFPPLSSLPQLLWLTRCRNLSQIAIRHHLQNIPARKPGCQQLRGGTADSMGENAVLLSNILQTINNGLRMQCGGKNIRKRRRPVCSK